MPPSESAIESKIEQLKKSPGTFQRLAEHYACIQYPDRFKNLIPQGRTSSDVTIRGWPDAYSEYPDRRIDILEATHSPAWQHHLDEDLQKAQSFGNGRIAGFVFVVWDNEPGPNTIRFNEKEDYRNRLIALGIPSENVNFIFKKELVNTLSQPRFASTLNEILCLPCNSQPFRFITQVREIFGSKERPALFAPTKEEYFCGLVHRPSIADEIENRLDHRGWAYVRGRGATGKTVLAIQIALSYEYRFYRDDHETGFYPAYYLNLADGYDDSSDALEVITTFADEQVLFIVDNVHQDEKFANEVFNHWQQNPMGSRLLLFGRDVSSPTWRGTAQPLDDIREDVSKLEIQPEDLAGVFRRLALRHLPALQDYSKPPLNVLEDWHRIFKGEIIAFSAAVTGRIKELTRKDWRLEAGGAAKYIREVYLDKADITDKLYLLRIAVLAQLEMDVPKEAIESAKIKQFLDQGLVHHLVHGPYEYYNLAHPNFGDLLLVAAGYSGESEKQFVLEQLCHVAISKPFTGMIIAARLESLNREQEAISVLRSIVESDRGLINVLSTSDFRYLHIFSECFLRLNVLSASDIDQKLIMERLTIFQSAMNWPLKSILLLLEYTKRKLPGLFASLRAELNKPENLQALSQTALHTPLGDWASSFEYAERKLSEEFAIVRKELTKPENLKTLSQTALRTQVHFLISFFEYTERKLPEAFAVVRDELAKPENLQTLSQTVLRTTLGDLAPFLEYAERKLPEAFAIVRDELAKPENLQTLSQTALRTPLGDLASFLQFTERKLPTLSKSLNDKLSKTDSINIYAKVACRTPLCHLLKFLKIAKFASSVVFAIDKDKWEKAQFNTQPEQPSYFPEFAGILKSLGRPEFAEIPARVLIRSAKPHHWHAPGIGLNHLGHVMRLGTTTEREELLHFLACVVTPTWLNEQYRYASTGSIAASLFGLWGYYEQSILDHFKVGALKSRVIAEMSRPSNFNSKELSALLQLLGCSALIGVYIDKKQIIWPNNSQICEAIHFSPPRKERGEIEYIQIQLWLGLREMARLRPDPITVQANAGKQILDLWKKSEGYTGKQNALNVWMIDWLEQCAQSGWKLLSDHTAFVEAIGRE